MNLPDWRNLPLDAGVLPETVADPGRIVLWLPNDRDKRFQYWERIASAARADIAVDQGLCTMGAVAIRARESRGGIIAKLFERLLGSNKHRYFQLPGGGSAEQCGERQNNLMLVWPAETGTTLDEELVKSRWPEARRIQKLGQGLFVLAGFDERAKSEVSVPEPSATPESPRVYAEALLAAARQAGNRQKEATALTDLGAIQLNEGDPKSAMASLDKALAITRELGDIFREIDVVGNLGMALLAIRQVESARVLFREELGHARATTNQFAEKVALEHLGLASWGVRDFQGALAWFDQALVLARQLGDRHQEANLLWHQALQHAELGDRERAIAKAEQSVALFKILGRPQAASYGAYLQKYRMGVVDEPLGSSAIGVTVDRSPQAYLGGSMVASVMAGQTNAVSPATQGTSGPGLLRMAMSAAKAMAGFAASGFKTAPIDLQRRRLATCAPCEHHTGVRCRICGCFTSAKSRLLHEDCPIGKWPA